MLTAAAVAAQLGLSQRAVYEHKDLRKAQKLRDTPELF